MKSARAAEPRLPGQLEHGSMLKLLGYHLAQATIPANATFKAQVSGPHQLNKLEFTILMLLLANAEVTPKRLAFTLNVPPSNLTLILDRLEQRGLLERTRSEADRRVQFVSLSVKGRALARKLDKLADRMEDDWLAQLTQAERHMLFELLRRIAKHRRA